MPLYDPLRENADNVQSNYDIDSLTENLPEGKAALAEEGLTPKLFYPSLLYTDGIEGEGTSYPGKVLLVQPGDQIRLNFSNNIRIGDLTDEQTQQATVVKNNTYGNTASDGLGGTTSTKFSPAWLLRSGSATGHESI